MPGRPAPGLLGYVLADEQRTRNALSLLRWALGGAVAAVAVVAAVIAILALHAPGGAWLYGGVSGLAAGGTALCTRRGRGRRRR
ncbi:hypothetical protein FHX81_7767 [Saccharothrix saharensis]|uniref:Uncharacterized protein n=1 Tax=Saccharothrix saharensis TaxID=571190 RepID=A0A543JR37_9PSEU|nr:hypothetical protein FHX81_7767 [Saccharothrix saharensis]